MQTLAPSLGYKSGDIFPPSLSIEQMQLEALRSIPFDDVMHDRLQDVLSRPLVVAPKDISRNRNLCSFPDVHTTIQDLLGYLVHALQNLYILDAYALTGSAATYILKGKDSSEGYNDVDFSFCVHKMAGLSFKQTSDFIAKSIVAAFRAFCIDAKVSIPDNYFPYFQKHVRRDKEEDWLLYSFGKEGWNIECKIIFQEKEQTMRKFVFFTDSFYIPLPLDDKPNFAWQVQSYASNLPKAQYCLQHNILDTEEPEKIQRGAWEKFVYQVSFKGRISGQGGQGARLTRIFYASGMQQPSLFEAQKKYVIDHRQPASSEDQIVYHATALLHIPEEKESNPKQKQFQNALKAEIITMSQLSHNPILKKIGHALSCNQHNFVFFKKFLSIATPALQQMNDLYTTHVTVHNGERSLQLQKNNLRRQSFLVLSYCSLQTIDDFLNQQEIVDKSTRPHFNSLNELYETILQKQGMYQNVAEVSIKSSDVSQRIERLLKSRWKYAHHLTCLLLLQLSCWHDPYLEAAAYASLPRTWVHVKASAAKESLLHAILDKADMLLQKERCQQILGDKKLTHTERMLSFVDLLCQHKEKGAVAAALLAYIQKQKEAAKQEGLPRCRMNVLDSLLRQKKDQDSVDFLQIEQWLSYFSFYEGEQQTMHVLQKMLQCALQHSSSGNIPLPSSLTEFFKTQAQRAFSNVDDKKPARNFLGNFIKYLFSSLSSEDDVTWATQFTRQDDFIKLFGSHSKAMAHMQCWLAKRLIGSFQSMPVAAALQWIEACGHPSVQQELQEASHEAGSILLQQGLERICKSASRDERLLSAVIMLKNLSCPTASIMKIYDACSDAQPSLSSAVTAQTLLYVLDVLFQEDSLSPSWDKYFVAIQTHLQKMSAAQTAEALQKFLRIFSVQRSTENAHTIKLLATSKIFLSFFAKQGMRQVAMEQEGILQELIPFWRSLSQELLDTLHIDEHFVVAIELCQQLKHEPQKELQEITLALFSAVVTQCQSLPSPQQKSILPQVQPLVIDLLTTQASDMAEAIAKNFVAMLSQQKMGIDVLEMSKTLCSSSCSLLPAQQQNIISHILDLEHIEPSNADFEKVLQIVQNLAMPGLLRNPLAQWIDHLYTTRDTQKMLSIGKTFQTEMQAFPDLHCCLLEKVFYLFLPLIKRGKFSTADSMKWQSFHAYFQQHKAVMNLHKQYELHILLLQEALDQNKIKSIELAWDACMQNGMKTNNFPDECIKKLFELIVERKRTLLLSFLKCTYIAEGDILRFVLPINQLFALISYVLPAAEEEKNPPLQKEYMLYLYVVANFLATVDKTIVDPSLAAGILVEFIDKLLQPKFAEIWDKCALSSSRDVVLGLYRGNIDLLKTWHRKLSQKEKEEIWHTAAPMSFVKYHILHLVNSKDVAQRKEGLHILRQILPEGTQQKIHPINALFYQQVVKEIFKKAVYKEIFISVWHLLDRLETWTVWTIQQASSRLLCWETMWHHAIYMCQTAKNVDNEPYVGGASNLVKLLEAIHRYKIFDSCPAKIMLKVYDPFIRVVANSVCRENREKIEFLLQSRYSDVLERLPSNILFDTLMNNFENPDTMSSEILKQRFTVLFVRTCYHINKIDDATKNSWINTGKEIFYKFIHAFSAEEFMNGLRFLKMFSTTLFQDAQIRKKLYIALFKQFLMILEYNLPLGMGLMYHTQLAIDLELDVNLKYFCETSIHSIQQYCSSLLDRQNQEIDDRGRLPQSYEDEETQHRIIIPEFSRCIIKDCDTSP